MPGQTYETTSRTVVGWREWVRLDSVGVPWVKAKVDTGARTSSLHAFDLQRYDVAGAPWVRFDVHPSSLRRTQTFKVYRAADLKKLMDVLPQASPESWVEVRSFRGEIARLEPGRTPPFAEMLSFLVD